MPLRTLPTIRRRMSKKKIVTAIVACPPQGYSKGTLALATAARDVAETAISSAFKNGLPPTIGRPGTVGNKPFPKHWNQCLLKLCTYLSTLGNKAARHNIHYAIQPKREATAGPGNVRERSCESGSIGRLRSDTRTGSPLLRGEIRLLVKPRF